MKRRTYKSIKKIIGEDKNIDQKIEQTEEQIQEMKEKFVDTRNEFIEEYIEEPILRTDQQIKKDIVDNLFWNDSVDASDVKVGVTNGKAILSGTVKNYRSNIQAISEAWNVEGVKHIENQIKVKLEKLRSFQTV